MIIAIQDPLSQQALKLVFTEPARADVEVALAEQFLAGLDHHPLFSPPNTPPASATPVHQASIPNAVCQAARPTGGAGS